MYSIKEDVPKQGHNHRKPNGGYFPFRNFYFKALMLCILYFRLTQYVLVRNKNVTISNWVQFSGYKLLGHCPALRGNSYHFAVIIKKINEMISFVQNIDYKYKKEC